MFISKESKIRRIKIKIDVKQKILSIFIEAPFEIDSFSFDEFIVEGFLKISGNVKSLEISNRRGSTEYFIDYFLDTSSVEFLNKEYYINLKQKNISTDEKLCNYILTAKPEKIFSDDEKCIKDGCLINEKKIHVNKRNRETIYDEITIDDESTLKDKDLSIFENLIIFNPKKINYLEPNSEEFIKKESTGSYICVRVNDDDISLFNIEFFDTIVYNTQVDKYIRRYN